MALLAVTVNDKHSQTIGFQLSKPDHVMERAIHMQIVVPNGQAFEKPSNASDVDSSVRQDTSGSNRR
jgi:hypothetical protein